MKRMLALVLALVMVIGMMPAISVNAQTTDRVSDLVASMSLRDKITQMLMVDFRKWGSDSASATDFTVMNDEVRKIVEDYNFGSVIYFANNIKTTDETFNLTIEMQTAATKDGGIPLLIAADQEGGSVYRLGSGTALPGNMALGATYTANGTDYAYEAGKIIGSELSVLGINTNLAPVVDVNNNANNPVIGLRSYGDDAVMVGELASAVIAGMAEHNVIGTAKHFPGHGDTATDSHYGLPVVDKTLDVLLENELAPYLVAIDQGIEMIMTAHILYPQLEGDKILSNKTGEYESLPATMSDDILTGLLKGQMGFEGIVVTDAMNMAGISSKWDQVQSCVIAIQSGVDLICMPCQLYCKADLANLDAIIEGLIAAVNDGTIPMERVNDAVTRILTVKENRGILDWNVEDYNITTANAVVGGKSNRDMERDIAAAAVTVVKNENNTLPLNLTSESKVLMLVPYNNERAQMLMAWNRADAVGLIPEGAQVDYYRFSSATINSELQAKLDWADTYIINSEVSSAARMGYKHWLSAAPNAFCDYAAANGKTAIISSVDKPYDVQLYPNASAIVAAYGCKGSAADPTETLIGSATGSKEAEGPNIIAAVEVILGTYGATGTLPVNIPAYNSAASSYDAEIVYERGYGLTYEAKETRIDKLIASMSLRDKVTQMLMVDFRKWGADSASAVDFTVMNDEVRKIVEDYNFGSVIYFANNIKTTEETFALTQEMQAAATKDGGIALLIAADQEGGSVYRLGSGTALPGNMALGATYAKNGTKYGLYAGQIIGSELSVLGINTNLAPVVDVNNNANNPVIGLRSYSDNPDIVGSLASAVIAGMAEYNVIGTAKHFPGHGDTATDSHYGLPAVDKPLDVLLKNELKPYTIAIEEGIEMIMTAHILYPQLESDKILSNKTGEYESLPATMSDDILTGLLKGEMGFDGIVVTDAMNMAGISGKWDQVQSVVIAFQAGVDMICMPCQLYCKADLANLDAIIEGVIAAVENGTIPMERIDDANRRILTVKQNRGILDYNAEDYTLENAQAVVGSDENRAKERELAAAAVTVVKNDGALPLNITETSKVLMLCPYNNERAQMLMAWNRAKEACLIPEGAEVDYYRFSSATINAELQAKLDWADTYIIITEVSSTARMEYKHWLSAAPNAFCDYAAANGKTSIIASCDKPYDVQMYPNANAILAAYGCKGSSEDPTETLIGSATGSKAAYGPNIIAAVEVALGTFAAEGTLPVNVPKYDVETNSYLDEIVYERGFGLTYAAKEATEHVLTWTVVTEPTCTEAGLEVGTCSHGVTEEREIPALGHDYIEGVYCSNCGDVQMPFTDVKEGDFFYSPIVWALMNKVTTGATETTYDPNGNLLRAQFVTMLWRAAGEPAVENVVNPFTDVKEGDFFYTAVLWAVEKGITNGVSETEFGSYLTTNRAQAVTFLWRYLGQPEATATNNFTDVVAGEWYEAPINWAVGAGVTNGMSATEFGVNTLCNRAHAVTFLWRALVRAC